MKTFHLAAAIIAPLALIIVAGDAQAADNKWYSGLTCRRATGFNFAPWAGTLINPSHTLAAEVFCPLVRDTSSISSASVQVFDRGGGVDNGGLFRCGISYEFVTNSEFFGFSDSDATSGPGTNMQTINLGAIAGGDYYYGYCVIPKVVSGWSHLVSWKVVEN